MALVRQPFGLKELFGQFRLKLFKLAGVGVQDRDREVVGMAAEDDGTARASLVGQDETTGDPANVETRDGALKIFLAGSSTGTDPLAASLNIEEETLVELKRIRILLSLALGVEVSADDAAREP